MTSQSEISSTELGPEDRSRIKDWALGLGFLRVGVTPATELESHDFFLGWLKQGFHGSMDYLARHASARRHPRSLLDRVQSVWMLAHPCGPNPPESTTSQVSGVNPDLGKIARYAWGKDYHQELKAKLAKLAENCRKQWPWMRTRAVVDTAPLLERDFARRAGLGWIGKNTMLLDKQLGSHVMLAGFLTSARFPPDTPMEANHCGSCTRCLSACPTGALVSPGVLDARKCISYFTIEARGPFPGTLDERKSLGTWLFGCDICQDVCPWNEKALRNRETYGGLERVGGEPLVSLDPWWVLEESPQSLEAFLSQRALERTGWKGLKRNALWVLANLLDQALVSPPSAEGVTTRLSQFWRSRVPLLAKQADYEDPGITEATLFLLDKIESLE